jgi:two-component system, NarL family, invasion response regulator UvrY
VTVLVADDQASFREVVHQLVAATPGFRLVGEANCAEDALRQVEVLWPQLVLMDVRMPGMGGVEGARKLTRLHPEIMVVLISVHGPEELSPELVAGEDAAPFVPKQDLRPRLLRELWRQRQAAEPSNQAR